VAKLSSPKYVFRKMLCLHVLRERMGSKTSNEKYVGFLADGVNHDIFQMSDHVSTIVNWTWIFKDLT